MSDSADKLLHQAMSRGGVVLNRKSTKEAPVKLGKTKGDWEGTGGAFLPLPGGALLQFDLSNLDSRDYRMMKEDPYIALCLNMLKFLIYQVDWEIECEKSKVIADATEGLLRDMWTPLVRSLSRALWAGNSTNAKVWDIDPYSKYITIDKIRDLEPETCEVFVGNTLEERKINAFKGIKQGVDIIEPEYALYYPLFMEAGNWEGQHLLKAAYPPWFMSQVIHLYTNRYYERFGEPTTVGHAPHNKNVQYTDGTTMTGAEAMELMLEKLRNHASVVLPSDMDADGNHQFDINLLESQMRGVDFVRYLEWLDKRIGQALLTPTLLFGQATTGSYNLGDQHKRTHLTLLNGVIGDMKYYIDRYVVRPMVVYNFGANAPKAIWKYKQYDRITDELIQLAMQSMAGSGLAMLDPEELSKYLGMKVKEIEQPKEPAAAATPTKPARPTKVQSRESIQLSGWTPSRDLRDREKAVDFAGIVGLFARANKTLKTEVADVFAAIEERLAADIKKTSSENYRDIKLGYKGRFIAAWTDLAVELYEDGRSQVAKEQGWDSIAATRAEKQNIKAGMETIAAKQYSDIYHDIQIELQRSRQAKRTDAQVLAAISLIFIAALADNSAVDKTVEWAATWAINQGRMDYATATGKAVYGVEWSAILDGRQCDLCEYLDDTVMASTSPYYGVLLPPAHFFCRCIAIPIFIPLAVGENLLKSIPEDLMPLGKMLVFALDREPVSA